MLIGAYCDYNNVSGYSTIYGKLYNWYAVKDSRNIAPIGWHIPSDVEFITLSNYLGGDIEAPNKLKEIGTSHWQSPNTGATNVSGFTALPGGMRQGESGYFEGIVSGGYWWCITEYQYDPNMAVNRCLYSSANNCFLRNYTWKKDGLSIRCIKD